MFRGCSTIALDAKGRLAVPSRYRERLAALCGNQLVLTLNPLDPSLYLYPLPEWEAIERKLQALSDFDPRSRRTKQMMRGYATDCTLDGQGRLLVPEQLRQFAGLSREVAFMGQGNKFEMWDAAAWERQREEWLGAVREGSEGAAGPLADLAL